MPSKANQWSIILATYGPCIQMHLSILSFAICRTPVCPPACYQRGQGKEQNASYHHKKEYAIFLHNFREILYFKIMNICAFPTVERLRTRSDIAHLFAIQITPHLLKHKFIYIYIIYINIYNIFT
jgi:hypothetical protein